MRGAASRAVVLGVLHGLATIAAADENLVGGLSHISRFEFRGCQIIPADEVKASLRSHWPFLVKSHPLAPREELVKFVGPELMSGYNASGFPDAQVQISLSDDRTKIIVDVTEGGRFLNGQIQIVGNKLIAADEVIKRLTGPSHPDDATPVTYQLAKGQEPKIRWFKKDGSEAKLGAPVWQADEPTNFGDLGRRSIRKNLEQTFGDLGFMQAKFACEFVPRPADRRVDLKVTIEGEGAPLRIQNFKFTGLQRQSEAEVLACFDKRVGDVWKQTDAVRMAYQLWNTGRFARQEISTRPSGQNGVSVIVELIEYPHSPSLSAPPSPDEVALMRLRDWLVNANRRGEELSFQFINPYAPTWKIEIVAAPKQGLAIRYIPVEERDQNRNNEFIAIFAQQQLSIFGFGSPYRFETDQPNAIFRISINLAVAKKSDEQTFNLGLSFSSDSEPAGANANIPIEFDFLLAPSFLLAEIYRPGGTVVRDGDLITITRPGSLIKFDSRTGRLIDGRMVGQSPDQHIVAIRSTTNRFAELQQLFQQRTANTTNRYSKDRELATTLAFGVDLASRYLERFGSKDDAQLPTFLTPAFLRACGRALDALPAESARSESKDSDEKNTVKFNLPTAPESTDLFKLLISEFASQLAIPAIDEFMKRDSWPAILGRELAFVLAGHAEHTGPQLENLYKLESMGPLGSLAVAYLLEKSGEPAAKIFANRGLVKLDLPSFQKDCDILLDQNTTLGRSVVRLLKVARKLEDQDIAVLGAGFFGVETEQMIEAARILRQVPEDKVPEVLDIATAHLWRSGLRNRVSRELKKRAGEN